ncbi:NUDIX domain-containing protein [Micrococcus sp.]|uniref:NUDIX hydrolase n=1 Tax=Micrococcus sp. TaxID=1271 RepID=UPI002A90D64E|nr:NUDIX domain-containing protein [Micrococcus sp.]MDY6054981.1 NUDIX domain-containing protein [Micrococcus sp.]
MSGARTIVVSAVVLRDDAGRVLTVRKRGTERFMFPGGKPEPGESAAEAAVREAAEEVGAGLDVGALQLLGVFETAAANEPGYTVRATVFAHPPVEVGAAAAEIAELRWLDPAGPLPEDLAPLLREAVLPRLAEG